MSAPEQLALKVEISFRPKTYDIDFAGHVSNIVYIRWLEDLRLLFLDTYLPMEQLAEKGVAPVVAKTTIEYKRPVLLSDRPTGMMWVSEMGNVRGILSAEFVVRGEVVTRAEQIGVFVKSESGRPVPFPEELRRQFEEFRKSHPTKS